MAAKDRMSKSQDYRSRLDKLTDSILAKSSYTITQIQETLKQTSNLKHQSSPGTLSSNSGKLNQLTSNLAQYQKYLAQLNTLLLRTEFFEDQLTLLETDITHTLNSNGSPTWDDLNLRTIESTLENLCLEFKHLSKRIEGLVRQGLLDLYSGRPVSVSVSKSPTAATTTAGNNAKLNNKRLSINTDEIVTGLGINTVTEPSYSFSNSNKEAMTPRSVKRHSYSSINRHSYHSIQRTPRTPLSQTFNANDLQSDEGEEDPDEQYQSDESEGSQSEKFMSQLKPIRCVSNKQTPSSTPTFPEDTTHMDHSSVTSQSTTTSISRRASLRNSVNSNKFNLLASIPKRYSQCQSARNSRLIEGMDLSTTTTNNATSVSTSASMLHETMDRSKSQNHKNRDTIDSTALNTSSSSFQSDSLFSQTRSSSIVDGVNATPNGIIDQFSPGRSLSPKRERGINVNNKDQNASPLAGKSDQTSHRPLKYKAKSIADFLPQPQLSLSPSHSKSPKESTNINGLRLGDPFKDPRKKRQSMNLRHFTSCETGLKLSFGLTMSEVNNYHENGGVTEFGGFLDSVVKTNSNGQIQNYQDQTQKKQEHEEQNHVGDLTDESVVIYDESVQAQELEAEIAEEQDEQVEDFRRILEQRQSPRRLQTLAEDEEADEFGTTFEHKLNRSNSLDSIFSVMTSKIPIIPASASSAATEHSPDRATSKMHFSIRSDSTNIRHMPSRNFSKPTLTWMRNISQSSTLASARISHQTSIGNLSTFGDLNTSGVSLNKVTMISVNTPSTRTFALNSKTKQNLSNLLSVANTNANFADNRNSVMDSRVSSAESVASEVKVTETASTPKPSIFNRLFSSSSTNEPNATSANPASNGISNGVSGGPGTSVISPVKTQELKPSALSALNKNMLRHQTSLQSMKEKADLAEEGEPIDINHLVLTKKKSMKSLSHKPSIINLPPSSYSGDNQCFIQSEYSSSITSSSRPITISHSSTHVIPNQEQMASNSKYLNNNILDSFITTINSYIPSNHSPQLLSSSSGATAANGGNERFVDDVKNNYVQKHRPTSKIDSVVASTSSGLKFVQGSNNVKQD
ncbi:hypothetical protein WICPIJ_009710 [Wickerhamomyces pijperi]|uniref:Uncharacterized protein n=1 Tax=Wickerhamomyces pijperi TaxID=599730 RepID=A0A9P8PJV4_WICPI|nr:hypothetical protein WICPIJ_009710 [Wickerhamomyces pijperi]